MGSLGFPEDVMEMIGHHEAQAGAVDVSGLEVGGFSAALSGLQTHLNTDSRAYNSPARGKGGWRLQCRNDFRAAVYHQVFVNGKVRR